MPEQCSSKWKSLRDRYQKINNRLKNLAEICQPRKTPLSLYEEMNMWTRWLSFIKIHRYIWKPKICSELKCRVLIVPNNNITSEINCTTCVDSFHGHSSSLMIPSYKSRSLTKNRFNWLKSPSSYEANSRNLINRITKAWIWGGSFIITQSKLPITNIGNWHIPIGLFRALKAVKVYEYGVSRLYWI